jgi:hypothetical protein
MCAAVTKLATGAARFATAAEQSPASGKAFLCPLDEGMLVVAVYAAVRQFVFNDGKSRREAARVFGLSRETVSKMCRFSMPPGYVRQRPPEKPKLGPLNPCDRGDPGSGPNGAGDAATRGQADIRASSR